MRDTHVNREQLLRNLNDVESVIPKYRKGARKAASWVTNAESLPKQDVIDLADGNVSGLARASLKQFCLGYSLGAGRWRLARLWRRMAEAFCFAIDFDARTGGSPMRHDFTVRKDTYWSALTVLSTGICLDAPKDLLDQVATAAGNVGVDGVFDRMAGRLGADQVNKVAYPRPWRMLLEVFDAQPGDRPQLMANFMRSWYSQMRPVGWFGSHKETPTVTGWTRYIGYWCFEGAAVVKLLGIDDSLFADNKYYPRDILN